MKDPLNKCPERPERISREYPAYPLVGVGAIIIESDRVVLVRRGKPPSQGEWSIPGGLVEVGEPLGTAVIREAREETGLEVEPLLLVELVERIFPDGEGGIRYHYILADYLCRPTGGLPAAGSDATDARWVHVSDLAAYGLAELTERVVRKAFALLHSQVRPTPACGNH